MSVERQFGVHEIPGTEEPAPQVRRDSVSAGFESQMRDYVNAIWAKLANLESQLQAMSSQGRPVLVSEAREARGERAAPPSSSPKPSLDKPWEAAGVSRRTWYRRHKPSDAA